uniref:uncharacterized protein LOC101243021 isoform X2 n=1 Tax=Ciona intestinalis TaxID=7719 RepID=UPI000EF4F25E|nr:uncharacterized protein LOC101243021 isoform X2 [Ciona intestinalis]|eukprot:XP_026690601.1 uncharacterized protein LOC101243021 isoform X2 [Ciona intestinalis]
MVFQTQIKNHRQSNKFENKDAALLHLTESKAREFLLHRFLDQHYTENLDLYKQCIHTGLNKQISKQNKTPSSRCKRGKKIKIQPHVNGEKSLQINSSVCTTSVNEAQAKRAIRRLVKDLRKIAERESDDRTMGSNVTQSANSNPSTKPPPARKVSIKQGSSLDQSIKTQETKQLGPDNKAPTTKSILKDSSRAPDSSSKKHVRLNQTPHTQKERRKSKSQIKVGPTMSKKSTRKDFLNSSNKLNLPGEMFSYSYLMSLLNTLQTKQQGASYFYKGNQVTLVPSPIRSRPIRPVRPKSAPLRRKTREKTTQTLPNRTEEDTENGMSLKTPTPPKVTSTKNSPPSTIKNGPQVRPGSASIKCSWVPEDSDPKPQIKASDHQLKNTDNPAIAEWLKRKNQLERQRRIYDTRKNRVKREKLMNEFNERENKREEAQIEYEKWKKRKNREILLRRRKEAHKASIGSSCEVKCTEDRKEEASNSVKFSDLRSSANSISSMKMLPEKKIRPKSAPTKVSFNFREDNLVPVKIDFESGDVTILKENEASFGSNLSAREPLMSNDGTGSKTGNFLKEFLEVTNKKPSMFDISTSAGTDVRKSESETQNKPVASAKKDAAADKERKMYNTWVRTGKKAPPRSNTVKKVKKPQIPIHDPMSNEFISDLAKRRIKKIMDQKKRVDTGLRSKRSSSTVPADDENTKTAEIRKWRLNENLSSNEEKSIKPTPPKLAVEERPKFTYNRKSKTKSVYNERNPVVRQALNNNSHE